jgi:hypothetical protein
MKAPMTNVLVEVRGGVVQNVAANSRDVQVVLVDWDNIQASKNEAQNLEWSPVMGMTSLAPETRRLYRNLLRE